MRAVITGTVGLDKVPYLNQVEHLARQAGEELTIYHVGQRMYAEAPDVAPGRILDLPLSRLHLLRRSVIKDILTLAPQCQNLIVNTHATFRWKHGLFPAFDFDQMAQLDPDIYVCLIDNVDALHARLERDHQVDHSLKDLLVWREEETLATELMMLGCSRRRKGSQSEGKNNPAAIHRPPARFYLLAIGKEAGTARTLYQLVMEPQRPKAYISFPMTHVADMPQVRQEIAEFRRTVAQHLIIFDPADLEEHKLYVDGLAACEKGQKVIEVEVLGQPMRFDTGEIMQVAGDIHAQIYARDFMLIDQSDMIISYIPELDDGKPGLSSGVERELQHAHEATKEVFVIWRPKVTPSPFITETATRVFASTEEALEYFQQKGYFNWKKPRRPVSDTLF